MSASKKLHTAARNALWSALEAKAAADPSSSFSSLKNGRTMPIWTRFDRRFCEMAELSRKITSYEERPDLLIVTDCGRAVPVVIDFSIVMNGEAIFVGLPLRERTPPGDEMAFFMLVQSHCAKRGARFVFLTGGVRPSYLNFRTIRSATTIPATGNLLAADGAVTGGGYARTLYQPAPGSDREIHPQI